MLVARIGWPRRRPNTRGSGVELAGLEPATLLGASPGAKLYDELPLVAVHLNHAGSAPRRFATGCLFSPPLFDQKLTTASHTTLGRRFMAGADCIGNCHGQRVLGSLLRRSEYLPHCVGRCPQELVARLGRTRRDAHRQRPRFVEPDPQDRYRDDRRNPRRGGRSTRGMISCSFRRARRPV